MHPISKPGIRSQLNNPQSDPVTPFAGAQKVANMLGDNAFLLEQLGFGHTTLVQVSTCTMGVVANYFVNSEVGVYRYTLVVRSH